MEVEEVARQTAALIVVGGGRDKDEEESTWSLDGEESTWSWDGDKAGEVSRGGGREVEDDKGSLWSSDGEEEPGGEGAGEVFTKPAEAEEAAKQVEAAAVVVAAAEEEIPEQEAKVGADGGGSGAAEEDKTAAIEAAQEKLLEEWRQVGPDDLAAFLMQSITTSSKKVYSRSIIVWIKFLAHQDVETRPALLLTKPSSKVDRINTMVRFVFFLSKQKGMTRKNANSIMTHLSYFLKSVGGLDTQPFMVSSRVAMAKAAIRTAPKHKGGRKSGKKLPMPRELMVWAREHFWKGVSWDTVKGAVDKTSYIGMEFMNDSGIRPGNITTREDEDSTDHELRCQDIDAYIGNGGDETLVRGTVAINEELKKYRESHPHEDPPKYDNVLELKFNIQSTKNKVIPSINIGRRGKYEQQFLLDLLEWIPRTTHLEPEDGFLTRGYPIAGTNKKRKLRRKDISERIKLVASENGLPPEFFACRSMRVSLQTVGSRNGMSQEHVNKRGGWAAGSRIPETTYDRETSIGGLLAQAGSIPEGQNKYGVRELHRSVMEAGGSVAPPVAGGRQKKRKATEVTVPVASPAKQARRERRRQGTPDENKRTGTRKGSRLRQAKVAYSPEH